MSLIRDRPAQFDVRFCSEQYADAYFERRCFNCQRDIDGFDKGFVCPRRVCRVVRALRSP